MTRASPTRVQAAPRPGSLIDIQPMSSGLKLTPDQINWLNHTFEDAFDFDAQRQGWSTDRRPLRLEVYTDADLHASFGPIGAMTVGPDRIVFPVSYIGHDEETDSIAMSFRTYRTTGR